MQWTASYQLFLFDFDGLLVDSEPLHYEAYRRLLAAYAIDLPWDFEKYCAVAQNTDVPLIEKICEAFPSLLAQGKTFETIYNEKLDHFLDLVTKEKVPLMPGVEKLLQYLKEKEIPRAVVTHSSQALVHTIRENHPILSTIPHWFTREDYTQPKPNPECYQLAIQSLAAPGDAVIGFEDSPKGFYALAGTEATPVLLKPKNSLTLKNFVSPRPHYHFPSFLHIPQELPPMRDKRLEPKKAL